MPADIRERARDAVRNELSLTLCDIFAAHGFHEVTVEEAARRAGISRATFFRYFTSKEDAVIAASIATIPPVESAIAVTEPRTDETPWRYTLRIIRRLVSSLDDAPPVTRRRVELVNTTPALHATITSRRAAQETELAEALARRLGEEVPVEPVAAAGIALMHLTWNRWGSRGGSSPSDLLDEIESELRECGAL
ncbi:MAG: TetR family transcriptional regulator [Pseudoclavibacter sp.]